MLKNRTIEKYAASGDTSPRIINIGTKWRMVRFTLQALHSRQKSLQYIFVGPTDLLDVEMNGNILSSASAELWLFIPIVSLSDYVSSKTRNIFETCNN
jgi:hypothetical protein